MRFNSLQEAPSLKAAQNFCLSSDSIILNNSGLNANSLPIFHGALGSRAAKCVPRWLVNAKAAMLS